jgi:hypothetical protein
VPGAKGAGWQELTGAPRAHFQIDGPRTVALRKLKLEKIKVFLKYKISFQNLKIGELNTNILNINLDLRVRLLPEPSKNYLHILGRPGLVGHPGKIWYRRLPNYISLAPRD